MIGTAVTALAAIVVMAIIVLMKRPADELGYVSAHWIAELHGDTTDSDRRPRSRAIRGVA
jgi:hypothetical protein